MKKRVLLALICVSFLLLSSCKESADGFFDYQNNVRRVDAALCYEGVEYGVIMEFKKVSEEDPQKKLCRLEYTFPSEVSGLVFERDGAGVSATVLDINISGEYYDPEKIFFSERLFSLKEEDLYSISAKKDGDTVGRGKNEECLWEVTTGKDGLPKSIVYEGSFGEIELKIEKIYQ